MVEAILPVRKVDPIKGVDIMLLQDPQTFRAVFLSHLR